LLNAHRSKNIKLMKQLHFRMLDDKASFYVQNFSKDFYKMYQNFFKICDFSKLNIPVFNPNSIIILLFKIMMLLVIIVQIVVLPTIICYKLELNDPFIHLNFIEIPTYIAIFDILMKLNTGFYNQGEIEMKRMVILRKYLSRDLIVDTLSVISINVGN
jgi:hypothetical protein